MYSWASLALKGGIGGVIGALWSVLVSCLDPGLEHGVTKMIVPLLVAIVGMIVWKYVAVLSPKTFSIIALMTVLCVGFLVSTFLSLSSSSVPAAINWGAVTLLAVWMGILLFSRLHYCQSSISINAFRSINTGSHIQNAQRRQNISRILLFCYIVGMMGIAFHLFPVKYEIVALQNAVRKSSYEHVLALLDQGIDVNIRHPHDGSTPLHWAVSAQDERIMLVLIERGASVNAKDREGKIPLHRAAFAGNVVAIDLLLAKGASINEQERSGNTPLHFATLFGHTAAIRQLLKHRADIHLQNHIGKTPLQMVLENHRSEEEEVLELFRKYKANEAL
jgi:hypothetical protein